MIRLGCGFVLLLVALPVCEASAAVSIPLTVTLSEVVTVTGTPQIAVDVGGASRFATYSGGTGTNTLTFTLSPQIGDVDLDGVTVSSPILLNGGTIKDGADNDATLTFTPPNTSGIKVDYPSLGLNFIADSDGRFTLNGTVYNDFPSLLSAAGGSFTRASIGTYFDSAGTLQTASAGIPRFDYDPVTHVAKGLLLEETRINYLTHAESFDNAAWTKVSTSISPDLLAAPSTTTSADKLIANATTAQHYMDSPAISLISGTSYIYSVYAKAAELSYIQIALPTSAYGNNVWANFNLATGTVATIGSSATVTMAPAGAGWYRISLKGISGATNSLKFAIIPLNSDLGSRIPSYAGDGTSGVYIWGAQVEAGAFATSYIPTTATAVTRSADNISIPVGSWFNASAGSISMAADLYLSGATAIQQGITIHGGTNQGYLFYKQASSSNIYAFAGTAQSNLGTVSSNTPFKIGMTYEASAAIGSLNGSLGGSISPTSVTTPTALDISSNPTGQWNGHLSSYKFYPLRATNAQLQLLTQ